MRAGPALTRPVILLFSDGEELGLVGASAFAETHPWATDVGCVVNLEARGTSGPSLLFETTGPSADLLPIFARSAVRPFASSTADLVYKLMPNDTDLSVFRARGVPGFNFAFIGGLERYHTPLDDIAHLDASSVQHQGEQALALTRELAASDLEHFGTAESVYFDVLGLTVVHVEVWIVRVVAVLTLLGALLRARRTCLASRIGTAGAIAALTGSLLALGTVLVLSWLLVATLCSVRGVPDPASAHPTFLRVALAALSLAAFCATASLRALRRGGFGAGWSVGCFALALVAASTAVLLPRAAHLVLVPALGWLVADFVFDPGRTDATALQRASASALVLALEAMLWIPILHATELGFGMRLGPVIAGPIALALSAAWPALVDASVHALRRSAWFAASAACACVLVGFAFPAIDAEHPAWLNLRYVFNVDEGVAQYEASTFGARLPADLAKTATFTRASAPPFPWFSLDASMHVAPAPLWEVAAPELSVLSSEQLGRERHVRVRLRSARGASRLHLHVADNVHIAAARWNGRELRETDLDTLRDLKKQLYFAVDADGIEVELTVDGAGPARVHLLDQDWTLPEPMRALLDARPREFVPRADGDVSIVGRSFEI